MSEAMIKFRLLRPNGLDEAVDALAKDNAQPCSGGTDLLVRLRKGLSQTDTLVDLTGIAALNGISHGKGGLRVGAGVSLAKLEQNPELAQYPAVLQAVKCVAGPTHREVATIGGNLCQDTRCVYYNQSQWWRKSNGFCLKYQGEICHVAPKGNRCRAAFSGDIAPALMVHDARIEIAGVDGVRQILLEDFYIEDGAAHMALQPGEIVVAVHLPPPGLVSEYEKIRVRGSVDYPLAGVAVACSNSPEGIRFKLALTGTNSKPFPLEVPEPLGDEGDAFFLAMGKAVQKAVSPQRTTTIAPHYRRLSVSALAVRIARRLAQGSK